MNWKEYREDMKTIASEDREERRRVNLKAVADSGLSFKIVNKGETLLFRDDSRAADFYPSSGRWTCKGKTYSGGAEKFLAWWKAAP